MYGDNDSGAVLSAHFFAQFRALGFPFIKTIPLGFCNALARGSLCRDANRPRLPEQLQTPVQICSFLSNLSLPLLLLANFSIILNTSGGYKMDLLRNGLASLGIIAISFLVYNRYFIGIAVLAK